MIRSPPTGLCIVTPPRLPYSRSLMSISYRQLIEAKLHYTKFTRYVTWIRYTEPVFRPPWCTGCWIRRFVTRRKKTVCYGPRGFAVGVWRDLQHRILFRFRASSPAFHFIACSLPFRTLVIVRTVSVGDPVILNIKGIHLWNSLYVMVISVSHPLLVLSNWLRINHLLQKVIILIYSAWMTLFTHCLVWSYDIVSLCNCLAVIFYVII